MNADGDRIIAGIACLGLTMALCCSGCSPSEYEPSSFDMSSYRDMASEKADIRPICSTIKCPDCQSVNEVCVTNALGFCCVRADM